MSNAVETVTDLTNNLASNMSVIGLIMQSDIVVKSVMALLVFASIYSWAVIFEKSRAFKTSLKRMDKFEKAFAQNASVETLYSKLSKSTSNPLAALFVAGVKESKKEHVAKLKQSDLIQQHVYYAMQKKKNAITSQLENNLTTLATIGSASPFIGLFGTVWGIVNSFQAIAIAKNTSLAVVAPGIAEALLATAIGLFAAIPATIFYNQYLNQLRLINTKFEDNINEMTLRIS